MLIMIYANSLALMTFDMLVQKRSHALHKNSYLAEQIAY